MASTRTLWLLTCLLISSACGIVTPAPVPASPTPPALTLAPSPVPETPTSPPSPTPTIVPTGTLTPLNLNPQVLVLSDNFLEPDDLVLAPDGSIYISDVAEGTIKAYTPEGQLNLILSGLSAPEGMAFLPDSSMVVAEQGTNRLLRYDFQANALSPFLDLVNNTNNLGVDGIIFDGTNLIVPDSPNGTVLEVSADGTTVGQLASGLVRPTGAWTEADGSLLIADEYGNAVFRLHRDGALEKVADFSIPDDVIADADGNIFVVTLGDDAVHVLTANQDLILVSGLNDPQGIIFDRDENLIVTDSGNRRLLKVLIH